MREVRTTIQKFFYRNGQRHGVARIWHGNGLLASEESYANGFLHGLCRQWSEAGRLLVKYKMVHGTGIRRTWHEGGSLQMEISTARGEFCERCRSWLSEGTLLPDDTCLRGKLVGTEKYRAGHEGQIVAEACRGEIEEKLDLTKNRAPS